jgi:hypothetical protein
MLQITTVAQAVLAAERARDHHIAANERQWRGQRDGADVAVDAVSPIPQGLQHIRGCIGAAGDVGWLTPYRTTVVQAKAWLRECRDLHANRWISSRPRF